MGIIEWIVVILVLFWLAGLVLSIGGAFIHTLLVIAVIIFVGKWLFGGR
ncbi:MAG: lmo0937 family membrane protein [Leifsonia sp.]